MPHNVSSILEDAMSCHIHFVFNRISRLFSLTLASSCSRSAFRLSAYQLSLSSLIQHFQV